MNFSLNLGLLYNGGYQRHPYQWNYRYGQGVAFSVRLYLLAEYFDHERTLWWLTFSD
jgi:hypothetical protein